MERTIQGMRFVMGPFFICSGVFKILSPEAFVEAVARFIPYPSLRIAVVILLPVCEVFAGFATLYSYRLGIVLPAMFLALTTGTLYLRMHDAFANVPCGCFGSIVESTVWTGLYIRNAAIGLVLLLLQALLLYRNQQRCSHIKERL